MQFRGRLSDVLARVEEPAAAVWPAPVAGLVAGAWAVAMSLLAVSLLVLFGWVFAPLGSGQFGDVMRASTTTWIVADGGVARWQGAVLSLPPLLATFGLLLFQRRAGRWLVGAVAADGVRAALWPLVCAVAASVSGHALLTAAAADDTLHFPLLRNVIGAAVVGLLGFGWGVHRELDPRWPEALRHAVRTATAFLAVLGAGAGVLLLVLFVAQRKPVLDVLGAVAGDTTSTVQVLFLCLLYLPTVLLWICSVLLGLGFTLGTGTHVMLGSLELGALPPVPLLGLLPNATPPWAVWLVLVALAAGVAAWWTIRDVRAWQVRAASVGITGLVAALLGAAASGGMGPARLAHVGTQPMQVGIVAAGWVALALLVDEVAHWVRIWRHTRALAAEPAADASAPAT